MNDIASNLPAQQFGGSSKVRTEHLIDTFSDKVLKMLDSTRERAAVLASAVDWTAVFNRIDTIILS